jgi:hypothetical protein
MRALPTRAGLLVCTAVLLAGAISCATPPVTLSWVSPADGAVVRGLVTVELTGQSLANVEVFAANRMLARAVVGPGGGRAVATIDTATLANGRITLTAHGWNSAAGTAFTGDADAGARSFTVANGGPGPSPTTTSTSRPPAPTTTSTRPAPPTTAPSGCGARPSIPATPRPLVGVYTGNDPAGPPAFDRWLGRPADGILGYTGNASWTDYDGSVGWAIGVWKPLDRPVFWSVPLIPSGATLEAAANGDYNDHYRKAAQQLAAWRPQDPIVHIRTGWEFNGDWFPWAAKGKPEAFRKAFQQFVTTFRSASPRFVFEWNVNVGDVGMNPETAYPGDCYVDIIGMDFYWNTQWDPADPAQAWSSMLDRPYGLRWHQSFAAAHGKRTTYSEWGVGNNGAGPYIAQAQRWFADHQVVFHTYWDSNTAFTGKLSSGQFTDAGNAYRQAFR